MTVDKNEAQDYLEAIEKVQQQTRRALAQGGGPLYLMIWAAVWLVGFLGNQYAPPAVAGKMWAVMDALGVIASFYVGWRMSRQVRRPGYGARIGWFWLAWLAYGFLIFGLAGVRDGALISVLFAIYAMFGYVVMGLWLWRPLVWIGLGVTALAALSYLFLPAYVNLIMAFLGSGTLFFSGLDMYRNWR